MKVFLTIFFLISFSTFPQSNSFDFHSPENIKKFADYLFCEGDFLRAVQEYNYIPSNLRNDTTNFKIMLCYSKLNLNNEAEISFLANTFYQMKTEAKKLYLKNEYLNNPISFQSSVTDSQLPFNFDTETSEYFLKLRSVYFIQNRFNDFSREEIFKPFDSQQKEELEPYYELSMYPNYKSPALSGILSAIIPGTGKMYVGEWSDGITAFIATGLFAFLAYDNFKADHQTRAWIFTGLGAFFYAGNIYGSIASAQIFNAKVDFEFNNGFKLFLEKKNYYLPHYDFCK